MAKKTVITKVLDIEVGESILEFPQNRTLLVEKLTQEAPTTPHIVKGLDTVDKVFEHYKPKVDVEFQDMDGNGRKETLNFNGLGDFGVKGITAQSQVLKDLTVRRDEYQNIIRKLKNNKQLRSTLDPEYKQALTTSLLALLKELENV